MATIGEENFRGIFADYFPKFRMELSLFDRASSEGVKSAFFSKFGSQENLNIIRLAGKSYIPISSLLSLPIHL